MGFAGLLPTKTLTNERITLWEYYISAPLPHRWWVAEIDDDVVGFVGICPSRDPVDPELGELNTIAIDPDHWRSGIGRRLMSVATQHLHTDGYREAILWTLAKYERGQRFYEAMGWRLDDGTRDEGRQVRYRLRLKTECEL